MVGMHGEQSRERPRERERKTKTNSERMVCGEIAHIQ